LPPDVIFKSENAPNSILAHSAPPDPLAGFYGGPTFKGREGKGREEDREGRG